MKTDYFKVKNFDNFQHYKDRSPPWIKLYHELLDNYDFACLQDASKLHLILIWLLASRNANKLPINSTWIGARINATEKVDLDALFAPGFIEKWQGNQELPSVGQDASKVIAEPEQSARPEKRREEESRGRFKPPSVDEVRAYCKERNNGVDADKFVNFYESKGWLVGKAKMKSWQASVRTWEGDAPKVVEMRQGI